MSVTLNDINNLVNDKRRDTGSASIDMTQNGFRAINSTLNTWNIEHDWPWQFESTIINYNQGITVYPLPSSLAFKAVINLRPYSPTMRAQDLYYISNSKFDSDFVHPYKFATRTKAQAQQLRIRYSGDSMTVNPVSSTTSNGTWVAAAAISTLSTDVWEHFEQPSSLKFNYSGTSGSLTVTSGSALNLSEFTQRSNVYFNVNLQSVTNFTSITLKIGSDASNYITGTISTDYLGAALGAGQWSRCVLPWNGLTTVIGSPDYTNMQYVQFTIAYGSSSTMTGNRIENLFVAANVPMTLEYYSRNMAIAASGSTKTPIFANSANTTDTPLWSGEWDWANETFVNGVMETVSYLTGERDDEANAQQRVVEQLQPLKARLPSKRRYPQFTMMPDVNEQMSGSSSRPYSPYGRF
jgi:hypothetical protein